MNYGIFRKGDLNADTPRLVAFIDPGYGKTSFYLGQIKKNSAEIIFEKSNSNLGIRNLD
jgi:heat shock protein 4